VPVCVPTAVIVLIGLDALSSATAKLSAAPVPEPMPAISAAMESSVCVPAGARAM
jgi:hypothetical protein